MSENAVRNIKGRIWRRIVVKSAVLALWAVGVLLVALKDGQELAQGTYWYMLFAIVAAWVVSTVRDMRRLHDEDALKRAAIEETDERNVLIAYKATRIAVVAMVCLLPVAMFACAYLGRQDLVDAMGFSVCVFLVLYLIAWFCVSRKS